MASETKERPIIFDAESVRGILSGRDGPRRKLYVRRDESTVSPSHIVRRLANGLDEAPDDGCWVWRRTRNNQGYGTFTIRGKTFYAHRKAWEHANRREIPVGMHVCHRCDNPACINPSHLFLGTRSDNMRDCVRKGRARTPVPVLRGESNGSAKLTASQVLDIRERLAAGAVQLDVARAYGVSQSAVSNIKRGKAW